MKILSIDPGRQNLATCLVDFVGDGPHIESWGVRALPAFDAISVAEFMKAYDGVCDLVVVETQLGKNPKMKRLEHWIEMYCAMKNVPYHSFHAREKLRYACPDTKKMTYAQRKKASVHAVQSFLASNAQPDTIQTVFSTAPKKDDLADSLLQALAFYKKSLNNESGTKEERKSDALTKKNSKEDKRSYQSSVRTGSEDVIIGQGALEGDT